MSSIWRNPDFVKFWVGETVSVFGSAVTALALPLTAVVVLKATPAQMGLLVAAGYVPFLLVGLLAGVWVDRFRRRPILLSADIAKAILLGSIPVAAFAGRLAMGQILIVSFLTGTVSVIDAVAYQAFMPSLLRREDLVEGNSKLEVSNSVASIAGPSMAGFLVQLVTAPMAIAVDAASFVVSAVFLVFVRTAEPPPIPQDQRRNTLRQIGEGLRAVVRHPLIASVMWCGTMHNFFARMIDALYVLYATNELHLSPALLGIVVALGGPGALLGSLAAARVTKRFGVGPTIVWMQILSGISRLLIPLAVGSLPLVLTLLMSGEFLWGIARPIFNITQVSLRQAVTPDRLQGRVNASIRFVMWGVTPFGALLGGVLGEFVGPRATMLVAAIGVLTATVWVFFSPIRQLLDQPVAIEERI
jgi:predicted MFS family arabinose efflux permease